MNPPTPPDRDLTADEVTAELLRVYDHSEEIAERLHKLKTDLAKQTGEADVKPLSEVDGENDRENSPDSPS
jgi:hypothetical protein